MTRLNRRQFITVSGAGVALAALPFSRLAAAIRPRVVVIGGGFAGATAAKYLSMWGNGAIDVTLVDPATSHISCIGSNLVLNGQNSLAALTRSFATVDARPGVTVMTDTATSVDAGAKIVTLASTKTLGYDHLIVAPGIDFSPVPGHDFTAMPHAWIAGPQTTLLRNQLNAMANGGTFVLAIPHTPFRAHTGPYERACVVADFFRRRRPNSKVVILDANPAIAAMKTTFTAAFTGIFANIVKYTPNVVVTSAVAAASGVGGTLNITINGLAAPSVTGNVVNLIPKQKAGKVAFDFGLVPAGASFAPINPLNYESTVTPNIHVIGDSQSTGQSKSGHMANSQAKVCVDAILRALAGLAPDPAPKTSALAFPPITFNTASWTSSTFMYDPTTKQMRLVTGADTGVANLANPGEAPSPSQDIHDEGSAWLTNLLSDSFA